MDKTSTSPALSAFQQRLRTLRKGAGLTQPALAERVGISTGYMWALESRRPRPRSRPGADLIERLASTLGTTSSYLLHGLDDTQTTDEGPFLAQYQTLPEPARDVVQTLVGMLHKGTRS